MKKTNKPFALTVIAFLGFAIISCNNGTNNDNEKETTSADTLQSDNNKTKEKEFTFVLPSPIQVAAIFNRAGLKFNSEVLNPTENLNNYNTKTSRYLNFGTYSSDLAFCSMNNKQQLAIDYINTLKSLADEIGMPTIFTEDGLVESFERNIGNQDSMLYILSKVKQRTDEYLEENSRESRAAVFFAGAWVEGMYIGSHDLGDNERLKSRLLEQMVILKNLIRALETQRDNTLDLDYVVEGLQDIYNTFLNFEGVKSTDQSNMDIFEVDVTDEELQRIRKQIVELRTKIVNS